LLDAQHDPRHLGRQPEWATRENRDPAVQALMEGEGYVTDRSVATAVYLATALGKPLLVEGHPGVGKTEIAKVVARALDTDLIRLQSMKGWMSRPRSTSGTIRSSFFTSSRA
jgi:MoxR-like ATPase